MPIEKVEVIQLGCVRCGHKWQMRHDKVEGVRQCPHCRTKYWDKPKLPAWQKVSKIKEEGGEK